MSKTTRLLSVIVLSSAILTISGILNTRKVQSEVLFYRAFSGKIYKAQNMMLEFGIG